MTALACVLTTLLAVQDSPPASSPGTRRSSPPAAATAAAGAPAAAREVTIERLQWVKEADGPDPITTIEVRNDFGDIRARAAADRRLEAWMVVQRLDPAGERVGFTVERRGAAVALVVGYPPGRVRDADPHPAKDSYDRLDLVVYVPQGVTLRASTLRGQLEVRRLRSDVDVATQDGAIAVRTTGAIRARTTSGSVTAVVDVAALAHGGLPLLLQSESGAIHVTVPRGAAADLRVETGGKLVSSLPLRLQQEAGRTRGVLEPASLGRLLLVTSGSGAVTIEGEEP